MTAPPVPDAWGDALEAASEDDRLWFEAHPHRQHRIRPYRPGEWPCHMPATHLGWHHFTAVRQVAPGVRMRLSFQAEGQPASGEHAASRIFQLVLGGGMP
jgi:hypothetical protein